MYTAYIFYQDFGSATVWVHGSWRTGNIGLAPISVCSGMYKAGRRREVMAFVQVSEIPPR